MKNQTNTTMIRIAILDDHPLIRKAMQYSLMSEADLCLVGQYGNRRDILPVLAENNIDVLVLDYLLGDEEMDGLPLIRHLRSRFPKLKIIVSSAVESPAIVQLVIKAGVRGFVGKSHEQQTLIDGIRAVSKGKCFITSDMQLEIDKFQEPDHELKTMVLPREQPADLQGLIRDLTPREREVIRCYLNGMTIMQIAAKYSRSRKTISGQKQSALRKFGLRSDLELFKFRDYFQ